MGKTGAERQAKYRAARANAGGDKRINTWITAEAAEALDRLSKHHKVSKRAMIELLATAADQQISKKLPGTQETGNG